jgi:hypothetical protein
MNERKKGKRNVCHVIATVSPRKTKSGEVVGPLKPKKSRTTKK